MPFKSVTVQDINHGDVIKAMSPYEALAILKDEIKEKYELDNEYYKYKILKFLALNTVFKKKEIKQK